MGTLFVCSNWWFIGWLFRFAKNYRQHFVSTRVECAGCEHRKPRLHWVTNCPHNIQCMKQITVEEVLRACLKTLESAAT